MKYRYIPAALFAFFMLPAFAQDADLSLIPYRQGDLWGYADTDKKIVIKPEYAEADFFYEGYAAAKKGAKYGYISKTGKVVIPFNFYVAKPFRFGYFAKGNNAKIETADDLEENQKVVLFAAASLRTDGYEICINTRGQTMPQCPAIKESSAPDLNKPATVVIESNYSTVQKSELFDKIVGDYKMPGMEDNYYIAIRNNNYGVFNNKFEVIVPFEYSMIKKFNINSMIYLQVEKEGNSGILFGNGSVYMAVEYSKLLHVKGKDGMDYFIMTKDGKSGIKNSNYREVLSADYSDIQYDREGGFVLTGKDNLKGFYFLNGSKLEPRYADVKLYRGGAYVLVKMVTGKTGYVSNSGNEFFEE